MDGAASHVYSALDDATPSQMKEYADRRARLQRLHRFAPAAPIPVAERLPGPAFKPTMPPIPNEAIKEASEMQMPSHNTRGEPRIEHIQRVVVDHFPGVTMRDLNSPRRIAKIVLPRQIAMYLAKTMTARSLPDVGRRFGGRDHTTVLHAVRKIEALVASKPEIASTVEMLRKAIA